MVLKLVGVRVNERLNFLSGEGEEESVRWNLLGVVLVSEKKVRWWSKGCESAVAVSGAELSFR